MPSAFAPAFGQTTPSETPAPAAGEEAPFALRFLDDRLAVWRQRLKLEDWRISIALIRLSDLPPKTVGGIRWDKKKKSAVILVLDPSDYRLPFRAMPAWPSQPRQRGARSAELRTPCWRSMARNHSSRSGASWPAETWTITCETRYR